MQHKSFDVLLTAWSQIIRKCPGSRLIIVGGGDRTGWESYAKELGCVESIMFTGGIADPSEVYRTSGVFVLPSRAEGLSNALLEAQAWGLACVVSDIPGNRAVVDDGINGVVVPVGDADRLADAILLLLGDTGLRVRLGQTARDVVARRFAIHTVADRIVDLYGRLAARSAP